MKKILVGITAFLFAAITLSTQAQTLITNGNFETWTGISGNSGTPTPWSGTVVRTAGLLSGSTYAALIQYNSAISQAVSTTPTKFQLDFVFAATDPGSSNRSLNFGMNEVGLANVLNIRTIGGTAAGKLTLQAFGGGAWTNVVVDAFDASVYNSGSNTFTTLNAYNFSLVMDFSTSSYTISYGAVGSSMTTPITCTLFQNTPNGAGISTLSFLNTSSASSTPFAVDNVVVTAVPEPESLALIVLGAATLFGVNRRKQA